MISKVGILFLLFFSGIAAKAQSPGDSQAAFELYTKKVFPLMYQNCRECHSEAAIYPAGPRHSASKPEVAYPTFLKFIRWDSPEKSPLVKMAMNQHYCSEHQFNCKDAERIAQETAQVVQTFISEVINAKAGSERKELVERDSTMRTYPTYQPFTTEAKAINASKRITFSLSQALGGRNVEIELGLEEVGEDNWVLAYSDITGSGPLNLAVQKAEILINGSPLSANTGLELMDRVIYFPAKNPRNTQVFDTSRPTIRMKKEDRISLRFAHLAILDNYPTKLCSDEKKDKFRAAFAEWGITSPARSRLGFGGNLEILVASAFKVEMNNGQDRMAEYEIYMKLLCLGLESRIDFARPRRSPLVRQLGAQRIDGDATMTLIRTLSRI